MYTRLALQKTQEFRPIPGHHQPKLAAWSSVLLDSRSGCECSTNVSLCCCPSPAVVEASAEKFKIKKKKTDQFMLCSHNFLHERCCLLLVTACTNCHLSSASPRNSIARHRRFGILVCENDLKLSLQKLECNTISSLPPHSFPDNPQNYSRKP